MGKELDCAFEEEQRQQSWAQRQALSRVYSISDMRHFLRRAGSEAHAEAWLPTLDELTRAGTVHAMAYTLSAMWLATIQPVTQLSDRPPTDDKEAP